MLEALFELLMQLLRVAFIALILGVIGVFILALLIIGYLMMTNKRWD
ncbi:MAG: hypothetical protein ACTSP4_02425 [Candidatus Hodarchaeales archaeon]